MSSSSEMLSNMKEAGQSIIATRRPFRECISLSAISLPSSLSEATTRISLNLTRFLFHYAILLLFALALSLVYHPFALLLFAVLLAAWNFLFFSRDAADPPVSLFGVLTLDDRIIVIGLAVFTLITVAATGVWLNVFLSFLVGAALVCFHAALRRTDEGVDDYESPYGPMLGGDSGDGAGAYTRV
ncbi:PRA1 family protein D-like [Lotus japonicus]|uniref:PRA1 family protein D-like n=1 Tax=Lotus japonicus TaxID=34305 RepID=UPI002583EB32|nr:PRA1 family protein D-like [Lotus japonicus]